MSVLIKMKMPKCCDECDFVQYGIKGDWCYITEQDLPCICPLIELPDHGRLVDADDVIAESRCGIYWWETEQQVPQILNEIPTVIPAERSEDDITKTD